MNWRFTRPDHWVRFEALEPIALLFPVQRGALEAFEPRFADLSADPALMTQFTNWSRARDDFQSRMQREPPRTASEKWQKHYDRGVDVEGRAMIDDHQAKLRLKPFAGRPPPREAPPLTARPATPVQANAPGPGDVDPRTLRDLRRREWLMEAQERQRQLSPAASVIERREDLSGEEFLARYSVPGRPVILTGEMSDWPALKLWTPDYLARTVGDRPVEFQGGRSSDERFEMYKDRHRRTAPFGAFIAAITRAGSGNDAYLTAYNSTANAVALSVLEPDLGFPAKFLSAEGAAPKGMLWIGRRVQ